MHKHVFRLTSFVDMVSACALFPMFPRCGVWGLLANLFSLRSLVRAFSIGIFANVAFASFIV